MANRALRRSHSIAAVIARTAGLFGAGLFVAMSFIVQAGDVAAHSKLDRADPKPGSTVATPPKKVMVWFTMTPGEELDSKRSTLTVTDSRGKRVDDGRGGVDLTDMDRRTLVAGLKSIGPGTYLVRWKAVTSPDRDVASGSFRFTVAKK
ncbi:MAG: copper resistance CopC family protein [bacterium]